MRVWLLSPLSKYSFSVTEQCWCLLLQSSVLVACNALRISGRLCPYPPQWCMSPPQWCTVLCLNLRHVQSSAYAVTLLLPGSEGSLRKRAARGWAVVLRMALCCLLLGYLTGLIRELAEYQVEMLFGWWQPADSHHLLWGSSLSPACCAQLGTGRFLLMRKGEGRRWVAAVLLTLGGILENDRKSTSLCELYWWFTALPQWISMYSMV